MSFCVAEILFRSLSVIRPFLAISSSARPELDGSFGIATVPPSGMSATALCLPEYAPSGSTCTLATTVWMSFFCFFLNSSR